MNQVAYSPPPLWWGDFFFKSLGFLPSLLNKRGRILTKGRGKKSNSVELYTFLINKYGSYLLPVNFRPSELLTNLQIYLEALKPAGGAFVKICFILFTLERAESCGCDQSITNHYSKQRALQKKVVSSN